MDPIDELHTRIFACRLCQEAGFIPVAEPVTSGRSSNRIMLVGQAPGITELEIRKPFSGRAGRVLFRWMESVGISQEQFREHVYMTAITKCYPGRALSGTGDRRPSRSEIELCRPFLDAQLELVYPDVILAVGGLALERFFPKLPLVDLVGHSFVRDGVELIPLPHPSGASRWLNDQTNKILLQHALDLVSGAWQRVVVGLSDFVGSGMVE